MSPDSSSYIKGLRLVTNLIPYDGGSWRELGVLEQAWQTDVPADHLVSGCFSDPAPAPGGLSGAIYVATSRRSPGGGLTSRIFYYEPGPATFTNCSPGGDFAGAPQRWRFTKIGLSVIAAPDNLPGGPALELQVRTDNIGNFADLVTSVDRPAPRFVGTSKNYLIGAHNLGVGGAGVYANLNAQQFMWSARNDATEFTPGTDRSNFAQLSNSLGEITGLACFQEFFVLFQELGVTRATWIGGDAVWETQQIASASAGLRREWSGSIANYGRDVFYMSASGPMSVINGEAVTPIGRGVFRRSLMDRKDPLGLAVDKGFYMDTVVDPLTETAVATAAAFGGDHFLLALSLTDSRLAVVNDGTIPEGLGVDYTIEPTYPLGNLTFFQVAGLELQSFRFREAAPRATMAAALVTGKWRPETGSRAVIHAIRLLLILDRTSGVDPLVTYVVRAIKDPAALTVDTYTFDSSDLDENGWVRSSFFPMEGNEFEFQISWPSLGPAAVIRELPALELAYEASSVY